MAVCHGKKHPQNPPKTHLLRADCPHSPYHPSGGVLSSKLSRVKFDDIPLQLILSYRHFQSHGCAACHISDDSHCGLDVHQVVGLGQVQELLEVYAVLLGPG